MGQKKIDRISYIDALRGLAVLAVILFHTLGQCSTLPVWFIPVFGHGDRGVQLFFIVSAFTMFYTLDKQVSRESQPIRNFYIRRVLRIIPLYYCGIIFYSAMTLLLKHHAPVPKLQDYLITASFTNVLFPHRVDGIVPGGWSISVEMIFYIFVPFLYKKIRTLASASKAIVVFSAVAVIFRYVMTYSLNAFGNISASDASRFVFYTFPTQLPVFLIGIFFYYLYRRYESAEAYMDQKRNLTNSTLLLVASVVVYLGVSISSRYQAPYLYIYAISFVIFGYSLVLYTHRFIVNKFTCFVGKISYSMYVSHFMVVTAMVYLFRRLSFLHMPVAFRNVLLFSMIVLVTILVSYVAYQLVEAPSQKLARKIVANLETRGA